MAVVTKMTYTNTLKDKFSWKNMKSLMEYIGTYNSGSQAFAIDANTNDIQDTGQALCFFEGEPHILDVDAALDISADTEGTLTAWATATSYTLGQFIKDDSNYSKRYLCIQAHTSDSTNKPGDSEDSDLYWEQRDHEAVNAVGTSITKDYDQWFMATVKRDGTLTLWKAGVEAAHDNAICVVPQYDPKTYCVIGFLHIANETSSAFVVGTTGLDTASVTDTFLQACGPVFPHSDNWDAN